MLPQIRKMGAPIKWNSAKSPMGSQSHVLSLPPLLCPSASKASLWRTLQEKGGRKATAKCRGGACESLGWPHFPFWLWLWSPRRSQWITTPPGLGSHEGRSHRFKQSVFPKHRQQEATIPWPASGLRQMPCPLALGTLSLAACTLSLSSQLSW